MKFASAPPAPIAEAIPELVALKGRGLSYPLQEGRLI